MQIESDGRSERLPQTTGVPTRSSGGWLTSGVILSVLVAVLCLEPFRVQGVSMLPELDNRERILVDRMTFRLGSIRRGDVVVLRLPGHPRKHFVKRVVGLPGERIQMRGGRVYVNGLELLEPYVPEDYRARENSSSLEVEEGHYYVLGDHRSTSVDSRAFGLVSERSISGRVLLSYWPLACAGLVR